MPAPHGWRPVRLAALALLGGIGYLLCATGPELEALPASTQLTDRHGTVLRRLPHPTDSHCLPVPLAAMAPVMREAMVAAEDRRFRRHPGIDPLAMLRAVFDNLRYRRVVSGASTLTCQIVRMADPRPRTFRAKAREAVAALRLERRYSKDELLEHYLNRAPFGGVLVGVEAASRAYFGKPAAALDSAEAALLAGLPQAPSRLRPDRRLDAALKRRRYVIGRLRSDGALSAAAAREAQAAVPVIVPAVAPFEAPHFCDFAQHRIARQAGVHLLRTTLDLPLQRLTEQLVQPQVERLGAAGIDGFALVVLDVQTRDLLAMIGSPDYFDPRAGQVNGALALRSPGSALKPFLFAEAFDRGLLTPRERLDDTPLSYGDYQPDNFDRRFRGSVSAHEALARSLNLPVLRLAERVGIERLRERLQSLELGLHWQPAAHYGLTLALGAAEVRLIDLANAYATLASQGEHRPPRIDPDAPLTPPRRIWSDEAAWMVSVILRDAARQSALASGIPDDARVPPLAFKTGTSNGYRDAWCLAYNPDYVVGVWVGRSDGAGHPDLIGAQTAVPIATALFSRLYPTGNGPWFTRPDGLDRRRVCAHSGLPRGPSCLTEVSADYIPGVSVGQSCQDCHFECAGLSRAFNPVACGGGHRTDAFIAACWGCRDCALLPPRATAGKSACKARAVKKRRIGRKPVSESQWQHNAPCQTSMFDVQYAMFDVQ